MTVEERMKYNSFYDKQVTDDMIKERELKFIKDFSGIRLSNILREYKIDSSNFYKGKVSKEKVRLVKDQIDKEIVRIYYESKN